MDINLLRSKMALKGDFTLAALAEFLELSRPALNARLTAQTDWTLSEIRKIVKRYNLNEGETCAIFGFTTANEN